jgi:hypothetical protein
MLLRFTYITLFLFAREAPGLLNVSFNGKKYAKLEHEAQYLEQVWHKKVCKPGQGCAEAVSVPFNKLCNRAELEFVGQRVLSLSKCSRNRN